MTISFYIEAYLRLERVVLRSKEFKPKTYMDLITVTLKEVKSPSPEELHPRTQEKLGRG